MSIYHIEHPGFPWFRFEWHGNQKVYCVRMPRPGNGGQEIGTLIIDSVKTPDDAKLITAAFLAGYQEKAAEPQLFKGNGPKKYNIFLETGNLGVRSR